MTVLLAPTEVADAAISPLLVFWTQITCEKVAMLNPNVHCYIAFLIPMGFFVYRESLLLDFPFHQWPFFSMVHMYLQST
jgi:hypothetical protein